MRRFSNSPPDWVFPDRVAADEAVDAEPISSESGVISDSRLESAGPKVALRCLADVVTKPLEWVLEDVIPRGEVTLLAGDAGVGKSRFAVGLIAAVLRGQPGPRCRIVAATEKCASGDSPGEQHNEAASFIPAGVTRDVDSVSVGGSSRPPGKPTDPAVVVFSSEQMLTDSIRPRLVEARADLSRVFALCGIDECSRDETENVDDDCDCSDSDSNSDSGSVIRGRRVRPWSFQLNRDLPILAAELRRLHADGVDVRMIVIDPIDRYLESQRNRFLLDLEVSQLSELAAETGVAILAVSNSGTAETLRSTRRPGGSGIKALSKVARAVWTIVRDLDVSNRRMLLPVIQASTTNPAGFAYVLRDSLIEWDTEPITITGDDYLIEAAVQVQRPLAREYQFEKERAAEWLYERLSAGRVASNIVRADAAENEISWGTLRRAFSSLGCRTSRERGKGRHGQWFWRLPGEGFFYRAGAPRLVAQSAHAARDMQLIETPEK